MSTSTKRPLSAAFADALELRALFPAGTYTRWELAGSCRRKRPEVGDVEHVIEPAWGEVSTGTGLFAETKRVNLFLHAMDGLYRQNAFTKHVYPNGTHRWGERYRGVSWRGFAHEFFMADAENWGLILLIRTGPAEYSRTVVEALNRRGHPSVEGYVRRRPIPDAPPAPASEWEKIACPDERHVLGLAGLPYIPPEERR